MLGLSLALELTRLGFRTTVVEAASAPGGLASPMRIGPYTWDRFYHVTLLSDRYLRRLLDELQLSGEVHWQTAKTGFYTDGRLYSMSNVVEFLRFPPLPLVDRLRLGATIFYASKIKDWQSLESIPVADWLRKLSGSG